MEEEFIVEIDEEAIRKERKKRKRRRVFFAVSVCSAFSCGLLAGIHWRVIKALIKGEELPKAPKWHRFFCHRT